MAATTSSCHISCRCLDVRHEPDGGNQRKRIDQDADGKVSHWREIVQPVNGGYDARAQTSPQGGPSVTDAVQSRFVSLAPDTRPTPKTDFERALHKLLDDAFALEPVWATDIGFHAYDDRWPDLLRAGPAGRAVDGPPPPRAAGDV